MSPQMTDRLVQIANRPIPSPSQEMLRVTKPASLSVSARAYDELALTFLWAVLALGALLLMFGAAVAFDRYGLLAGSVITWFCGVGVFIHGARYELAEIVARRIEGRYKRCYGRRSSVDSAKGQAVADESPSSILRLTRSSDWDFLVQFVAGMAIAYALR